MNKNTPLSDLRKSYEQDTLDEQETASEPLLQFQTWLSEALKRDILEPNAMTLATVGPNGRPSSRPVLIKGHDERGIVWYSNYSSRKGFELATMPFAALQFHWVELKKIPKAVDFTKKSAAFAPHPT